MASIFQRAMGSDFERLHPKMRARLSTGLDRGATCVATGIMSRIWHGTPLLKPLLHLAAAERLLLPETGTDVPFTMENRPIRDAAGRDGLTYSRTFEMPRRNRRFDTVTILDPATNQLIDILGAHRLITAEWRLSVDARGGLVIRGGRQRIRLGSRYLPLPRFLSAETEIHDWYEDSSGRFRIDVRITHPRLGTILGYQGTFTCRFVDAD
ncbi:MAG: DUF4166 domain-containing protein [Haloechinothrix sp.]